jgi:dihydroorotase
MELILRQGRVVDPAEGMDRTADVAIEHGRVSEIAPIIHRKGTTEIDARGLVVAPGFVDMHVHLREPGREDAETIESGTRAAARGGFTAVACMPNTQPVNDCSDVTDFILERARQVSRIPVYPIGAITLGSRGETLTDMAGMRRAGIVAVSDDGRPVQDNGLMMRALQCAQTLGLPVIDHCEDKDLAAGGCVHEGEYSTLLGLHGISPLAEEIQVARDIILARHTRARVHIAHLSARNSLEAVVQARKAGIPVTCEVTPHHLFLTDAAVAGYNTHAKMNPPLRTRADTEALVRALAAGQIDVIATDHAPHTDADKKREFSQAPFGVVGLETAVSLALDRLVGPGIIGFGRMVELFSVNPCRILNIEGKGTLRPGAWADVTMLDPARKVEVHSAEFLSLSRNTPFEGWQLNGAPVRTIVRGQTVWSA